MASDGAWTPPYYTYVFVFCTIEITVLLVDPDRMEPRGGHSSPEGGQPTCSNKNRRPRGRPPRANDPRPNWDPKSRTLTFRGKVVKHYEKEPLLQGLVLGALQEDGWPPWTDDPLPGNKDKGAKRQQRADTLHALSDNDYLEFRYDPIRKQIGWFIREEGL
jgi:hypothetical protein